jgi:hypothetical protein
MRTDWLSTEMEEITSDTAMSFDPETLVCSGRYVTLPLSPEDTDKLFQKMDSRFMAWTGRSLRHYQR